MTNEGPAGRKVYSRKFWLTVGLLLINGFLFLGFAPGWAALGALLIGIAGYFYKGLPFVLISVWCTAAAFGNSIIVSEYKPANETTIRNTKALSQKQKAVKQRALKAESKKKRQLEYMVWLFPLSNSTAFILVFLAGREYELY